jgi:hypothetical protein
LIVDAIGREPSLKRTGYSRIWPPVVASVTVRLSETAVAFAGTPQWVPETPIAASVIGIDWSTPVGSGVDDRLSKTRQGGSAKNAVAPTAATGALALGEVEVLAAAASFAAVAWTGVLRVLSLAVGAAATVARDASRSSRQTTTVLVLAGYRELIQLLLIAAQNLLGPWRWVPGLIRSHRMTVQVDLQRTNGILPRVSQEGNATPEPPVL